MVPSGIVGIAGLIEIETKAAGRTVRVADALTDPELMPIVVVPAIRVVATP